jgi:hypothetical protein
VTTQVLLVAFLAMLAAVAALGFHMGKRRSKGSGRVASVGEALRQVQRLPGGRVLVLILGDDEVSLQAGEALAADPGVRAALSAEPVRHVVLRRAEGDDEIAAHLFRKYSGHDLPAGPLLLLLDREGLPIIWQALRSDPLGSWLPVWLETQPLVGAKRGDGLGDGSVAKA